ncbi:hypothetical protein Q8A73_018241 [Channa argus]|nr:hypothetical protein Q8A73_018241 [Channa argus]
MLSASDKPTDLNEERGFDHTEPFMGNDWRRHPLLSLQIYLTERAGERGGEGGSEAAHAGRHLLKAALDSRFLHLLRALLCVCQCDKLQCTVPHEPRQINISLEFRGERRDINNFCHSADKMVAEDFPWCPDDCWRLSTSPVTVAMRGGWGGGSGGGEERETGEAEGGGGGELICILASGAQLGATPDGGRERGQVREGGRCREREIAGGKERETERERPPSLSVCVSCSVGVSCSRPHPALCIKARAPITSPHEAQMSNDLVQ